MGLTINYTITTKGNAAELALKLETIRQKCLDLPFAEVGEVKTTKITKNHIAIWNWLQNSLAFPNNSSDNLEMRDLILELLGVSTWGIIEAGVWKEKDGRSWQELKPTTNVSLGLWPGEGCESCDLNFYLRGKQFIAHSFCKTQYAVHFVQAHLLVVKMLDLMKDAGFSVEVRDEGKYYETRNLKILAKELGDYNVLVGSISGMLKDLGWKSDQIECALDKSQNIMKVN